MLRAGSRIRAKQRPSPGMELMVELEVLGVFGALEVSTGRAECDQIQSSPGLRPPVQKSLPVKLEV